MQEDLRQVFSDEGTADVTGALRSAMHELDADGDGGVSLNELLRVGLAGASSRSSGMNSTSQVRATHCSTMPARLFYLTPKIALIISNTSI